MNNKLGYTLLEVMVALVVFAILATTTSYILYQTFETRARVNLHANQLNELQLAMTFLQRDIEQIIERSVHGDEIHSFPAFIGRLSYLEFTHGGLVNPNAVDQRSSLARVAYYCQKDQLIRRTWEILDPSTRKNYHDKVILTNLNQCSFAYMSNSHQVLEEWKSYAIQQNQHQPSLPLAIQFTLTLSNWGSAILLFAIPESVYEQV